MSTGPGSKSLTMLIIHSASQPVTLSAIQPSTATKPKPPRRQDRARRQSEERQGQQSRQVKQGQARRDKEKAKQTTTPSTDFCRKASNSSCRSQREEKGEEEARGREGLPAALVRFRRQAVPLAVEAAVVEVVAEKGSQGPRPHESRPRSEGARGGQEPEAQE